MQMLEDLQTWADNYGTGPQNDGTYNVPATAQPNNQPWDTGGGQLGGYGSSVMDILKMGVGAAATAYNNKQMLDYKRYEATQGGAFVQGQPANVVAAPSAGLVLSPVLILVAVGLYFVLKK